MHDKTTRYTLTTLLLTTCLSACSGTDGDPDPSSTTRVEHPAAPETVDSEPEQMVADNPEPITDPEPACVPTAECAPDACGPIDDGCGGEVVCDGGCGCIEGIAQDGGWCGTCGLGVRSCEVGETGQGTCNEPDLSGSNPDMCQNILYVDVNADPDLGSGSRELPYSRIEQALERMYDEDVDAGLVLVATGTYSGVVGLPVQDSVTILGGFDPVTWTKQGKRRSRLELLEPPRAERVIGMEAVLIDEPTLIAHFDIITPDAELLGANTIGVRVSESPGLVLRDIHVQTGAAAAGRHGRYGADGTDATDREGRGESAGPALHADLELIDDMNYNGAVPGKGGVNPMCPIAAGGQGGWGARSSTEYWSGSIYLYSAGDGENSEMGARGGQAGGRARPTGEDGRTPLPPAPAEHGSPGQAYGLIEQGRWVMPNGDGQRGPDGQPGGGGGGGGGSWWPTDDSSQHSYAFLPGASGGGGGAGGCGGIGGGGGQAGGTSFGLLVIKTPDLRLEDSSFTAGAAGRGGAGGRGGRGGRGATGGQPTEHGQISTAHPPYSHPRNAGRGGDGADGAHGGDGGPGAGGSSFGVYCEQSTLALAGDVTFTAGAPGAGGQGELAAESGSSLDAAHCGG